MRIAAVLKLSSEMLPHRFPAKPTYQVNTAPFVAT